MKKIRLNENDIENLVKKIIKEEGDWDFMDDITPLPEPTNKEYKIWLNGLETNDKRFVVNSLIELGYKINSSLSMHDTGYMILNSIEKAGQVELWYVSEFDLLRTWKNFLRTPLLQKLM